MTTKQNDRHPRHGQGVNPTPTLSTSLRQTQPNRGQKGNFVKYLPQDEAVAAGLGAEDGALDPLESQRVVDLLNTQLSRLLKLKPKQFWTQGNLRPLIRWLSNKNKKHKGFKITVTKGEGIYF